MKIQDAYQDKMAAQLVLWGAEIDLLEAKAGKMGAEMKLKRAQEMQNLRAKHRDAVEKMKALEKATGDAWTELKATADQVWADLKSGLSAAHTKFTDR